MQAEASIFVELKIMDDTQSIINIDIDKLPLLQSHDTALEIKANSIPGKRRWIASYYKRTGFAECGEHLRFNRKILSPECVHQISVSIAAGRR